MRDFPAVTLPAFIGTVLTFWAASEGRAAEAARTTGFGQSAAGLSACAIAVAVPRRFQSNGAPVRSRPLWWRSTGCRSRLREVIDDAWNSSVLPLWTEAFVFAVIARGLGSDCDILITAAVREVLDARFALRELPPATVAGLTEPVVTYSIEGVPPI